MRGRMNELVEEEEEEEVEAVKEEAGEVGGVLEQEELDHRCPVPSLPEERREGAGEGDRSGPVLCYSEPY